MSFSFAIKNAFTLGLLCLSGLFVPAVTSAQDQLQPVPQESLINDLADNHPVARFVDASTLLVAEIDWQKIDVDQFFTLVQELTGDRPSEVALTKSLLGKLQAAQAGKVYLVADASVMTSGVPLVVIPCPNPHSLLDSIKELLGDPGPSVGIDDSRSALMFGTPTLIASVKSATPIRRSDLVTPLLDANRMDHTLTIAIPQRSGALLANLVKGASPEGFPGSATMDQVATDVRRVIVGVQTPPGTRARVTIEAKDAAGAKRLSELCLSVKRLLGESVAGVEIEARQNQVVVNLDNELISGFRELAKAARRSANEDQKLRTMKQLGLAFHNYESREKHLPPRCFVDKEGTPLHSWFVAVLPDFEQLALYRSIRLDKSWNAAENKRLERTVPAGINDSGLPVGHTTIRAPVFPGSIWDGKGPPKTWKDVTDEWAQTILLADAPMDNSIHWADPEPWVLSEADPMKDFFGDRDRVRVLMADGAVLMLDRSEMDNDKLRAMLTIAGKD